MLEYSPGAALAGARRDARVGTRRHGREPATVEVAYYLYGAVTAAQQVLPTMLGRGAGTALFTTCAAWVHPVPFMGSLNAAAAGRRNWAINLHGEPKYEPDDIAPLSWRMVAGRSGAEHTNGI